MADSLTEKVSALLNQAAEVHHSYETDELKGKRDEQWPAWYADYLLNNGLSGLTGVNIDIDQLTEFLEESRQLFKAEGSLEDWQDYTAPKLLEKFA